MSALLLVDVVVVVLQQVGSGECLDVVVGVVVVLQQVGSGECFGVVVVVLSVGHRSSLKSSLKTA